MNEDLVNLTDNNEKEDNETANIHAYIELIGYSLASSLVFCLIWLLAFYVILPKVDPGGGLGGIVTVLLPTIIIQWLLILPATGAVISIHKERTGTLRVNRFLQIGIPLIVNFLAANAPFIFRFLISGSN